MVDTDKDLQRRELVFRVLDDLKARGERVNADKVARLAKMGKQTVLPHYNEWRFLDDAEREVDEELPADLVRVLKRGLIQWKHETAESQRNFEEQANDEIDELQQTLHQLTEERINLKKQLTEVTEKNALLQQNLDEALAVQASQDKQLVASTTQLDSELDKVTGLQAQLELCKKEHKDALLSQEKQLDAQHHSQINHWMKIVDDERRLRADLEQQVQKLNDAHLKLEKERSETQLRLESKSKAHLEACEERNSLRQQFQEEAQTRKAIQELELLMKQPADRLVAAFQELLERTQEASITSQRLTLEASRNSTLEKQLNDSLEKNRAATELELQLEKQKGYSQALEVSLNQANELLKSTSKS